MSTQSESEEEFAEPDPVTAEEMLAIEAERIWRELETFRVLTMRQQIHPVRRRLAEENALRAQVSLGKVIKDLAPQLFTQLYTPTT